MSYASVTYTPGGSTTLFALPFDVLNDADLIVTVNGAPRTFTRPTPGQVLLDTAASAGQTVVLNRVTPIAEQVSDFNDTGLRADELNTANKQVLYAVQELNDGLSTLNAYVQTLAIGGGNLPAPAGASRFLVSDASSWLQKTVGEVQSILGINPIPAAVAGSRFLTTNPSTTTYELHTPAEVRGLLGLGTAATLDTGSAAGQLPKNSDLGNASLKTVGTAIGNVVEVVDAGGATPALPAISGALLTGVLHTQTYVRVEYQTAFNVNGGAITGSAWTVYPLNTLVVSGSIASLASNKVTLPAGTYRFTGRMQITNGDRVVFRLYDNTAGATLLRSQTIDTGTLASTAVISGEFTLSATSDLYVHYYAIASDAATASLGLQHNVAAIGNNIFGTLEFWKIA